MVDKGDVEGIRFLRNEFSERNLFLTSRTFLGDKKIPFSLYHPEAVGDQRQCLEFHL